MTPFIICGVPRSGTTIIARFIGALPGVKVIHEPFQLIGKHVHTGAVSRIGGIGLYGTVKSELLGFKEPFLHSPGYGCYPNGEALAALKVFGARFLWIYREPVATFNSQKHAFKKAEFQDVNLFIQNWNAYHTLRAGQPALDYNLFCSDPVPMYNAVRPDWLPKCESFPELAPVNSLAFMGCHRAAESNDIDRRKLQNIVTDEERDYILKNAI